MSLISLLCENCWIIKAHIELACRGASDQAEAFTEVTENTRNVDLISWIRGDVNGNAATTGEAKSSPNQIVVISET